MFFFSSRWTMHGQVNLAITSAVRTYTELCDHAKQKFNCTCANEYYGKFCHKKIPTSCKQLQVKAKKPWVWCIHHVWSNKQVVVPNLWWFHFWKWIRLDAARVLQLSQQKRFQGSAIRQRSPSKPELFQVEQFSPVKVDNEFKVEPFYAVPGNLQLQR